MICLMLVAENEREKQILSMAFEQKKIKTVQLSPNYSSFVKVLQYHPDIIFIEIPRLNTNQLYFSGMIRKHKKTKMIPIVGYGNKIEESFKKAISQNGISQYINRPLKFSLILGVIQKYLKAVNKSIEITNTNQASEKESDIKSILDHNTLPAQKIELMVKYISSIFAFPFTVAKTLQLTASSKSGANDLAKVIEADPVISANILKVSNSVFFASLNRRINSVKDAIVRLGFRETKRIVMTLSVIDTFDKEKSSLGFNRIDFWHHSLSTALIAEYISKRMGNINSEEAFLAGLLHDFGIILLDEFFPSIFSKILEATADNGSRFVDNEIKLLDISHNDLVKELFTTWKIPENITDAIYNHYTICSQEKVLDTPAEKLAVCISMGNIFAKVFCFGGSCDQYIVPIEDWVFKSVKMPTGLNKNFYEDISHKLDLYRKLLNIKIDTEENREGMKQIGIFNSANSLFIPAELYFNTRGHTVTRIVPSESYSSYNNNFDAVCIWADREMQPDSIIPFTKIKQHIDDNSTEEQKSHFAPALGIIYKNSPLVEAESTENLSLMYNEFDLRQLDTNLSMILDRKKIQLPQLKENPETSTSSQKAI